MDIFFNARFGFSAPLCARRCLMNFLKKITEKRKKRDFVQESIFLVTGRLHAPVPLLLSDADRDEAGVELYLL